MREQIIRDIIVDITAQFSGKEVDIIRHIIVKHLAGVEITRTLPATHEDTNSYLLKLFKATKGQRLSEKTVGYYEYTVGKFIDVTHKDLIHADALDVELFIGYMRKTNSETSCNNLLRNLSAFYTWMRKQRLIQYNPCETVERFRPVQKPVDHMSSADMDKLRLACNRKRQRALIEFLRCTALRAEEVGLVKIEDIDFASKTIVVFAPKTKTYRTVCLDDLAVEYIKAYMGNRTKGILFRARGTELPVKPCNVCRTVKYLGKKAKLKRRIYAHLFRKSTATNIVKRGGTIREAGDYLGHKDTSVTGSHYVYKDDSYVIGIFNRYVAQV